jgi:hypothetical protein
MVQILQADRDIAKWDAMGMGEKRVAEWWPRA